MFDVLCLCLSPGAASLLHQKTRTKKKNSQSLLGFESKQELLQVLCFILVEVAAEPIEGFDDGLQVNLLLHQLVYLQLYDSSVVAEVVALLKDVMLFQLGQSLLAVVLIQGLGRRRGRRRGAFFAEHLGEGGPHVMRSPGKVDDLEIVDDLLHQGRLHHPHEIEHASPKHSVVDEIASPDFFLGYFVLLLTILHRVGALADVHQVEHHVRAFVFLFDPIGMPYRLEITMRARLKVFDTVAGKAIRDCSGHFEATPHYRSCSLHIGAHHRNLRKSLLDRIDNVIGRVQHFAHHPAVAFVLWITVKPLMWVGVQYDENANKIFCMMLYNHTFSTTSLS